MTNEQLYIAVCIPVFAFIGSLIISLVQISGIREDMRQLRTEFGTLRSEVHTDLAAIRASVELLTGKVYEMMGKQ